MPIQAFRNHGSRLKAICGLTAFIVIPQLPIGTWIAPGESVPALLTREAVWWCYAIAVILWVRFGEGLPLTAIGVRRPDWKTVLYGLLTAAALLAIFSLFFGVLVPLLHFNANPAGAERKLILARPFWLRFLLVVRAAVVEEFLFRSYTIETVQQLTSRSWPAILISVATFTYAHLSSWGVVQLIPVFAVGIVLALLYVWRRDLLCNVLAHFLTDGAGFLFG